jgi:YVTN family beta-propeller protein
MGCLIGKSLPRSAGSDRVGRMVINRAVRLATIGALTVAAAAISPAASADSALPAYNVTQPIGVPNAWVVAVDPESHRVYVAGAPNQTVVVLDGLTGSTLATITVPYTPSSMAIDSAAHRLFILSDIPASSKDTVSVSIVDTTTNAILTTVPGPFLPLAGLAVDTFNHRVLVLPMVLDEKGRLITPSGPPVTFGGAGVAVDPSIQRLYVSNPSTGVVTVYNSTTLRSVVAVKVSSSPQAIAIDPQTHSVYVSDDTNGVVSVINGTTDKVTATIPAGATPTSLAVDSSAGLVYVSSPDTSWFQTVPSAVTVIDATDNAVVHSITVSATGGGANGIAVDPTTHTVWVAADQMSELQPVVSRRSGVDRFGTATAISSAAYDLQGADAVVLARSDTYPDALVGAPFAASKNAPLLYTSGAALPASTAAEITRVLSPGKTVYLLGGASAIPASIATQLTGMGYVVSRISGADRYATAVAVADAMGSPSVVFLATAANYADALAAGPAAAHATGAILLTDGTTMPSVTTAYLAAHPGTTYAVGGPAATADPSASAISGTDRYATATLVAQQFFATPTTVGLASGVTFADALPAAAYLARVGGPLLLTDPNALPSTASTYLTAAQSGVTRGLVFGGTTAVSVAASASFSAALGR